MNPGIAGFRIGSHVQSHHIAVLRSDANAHGVQARIHVIFQPSLEIVVIAAARPQHFGHRQQSRKRLQVEIGFGDVLAPEVGLAAEDVFRFFIIQPSCRIERVDLLQWQRRRTVIEIRVARR